MTLNAPIGVIDSGVGGLTVAKEIMKLLPNEQIFYIGDNARCPRGPLPLADLRPDGAGFRDPAGSDSLHQPGRHGILDTRLRGACLELVVQQGAVQYV